MVGKTKTVLSGYVPPAVWLVLPLSLFACGIYNRTPLLPGVNGSGAAIEMSPEIQVNADRDIAAKLGVLT